MHKNESGQITGMARLADALLNLAFDEEMLSVAWLLLADIVDYSVGNGRMPGGLKRLLGKQKFYH